MSNFKVGSRGSYDRKSGGGQEQSKHAAKTGVKVDPPPTTEQVLMLQQMAAERGLPNPIKRGMTWRDVQPLIDDMKKTPTLNPRAEPDPAGPASKSQVRYINDLVAKLGGEPIDTQDLTHSEAATIIKTLLDKQPCTERQLGALNRAQPGVDHSKTTFAEARAILDAQPASSKQVELLTRHNGPGAYSDLTRAEATALIEQIPATDAQLKTLDQFKRNGAETGDTSNITMVAASDLIAKLSEEARKAFDAAAD